MDLTTIMIFVGCVASCVMAASPYSYTSGNDTCILLAADINLKFSYNDDTGSVNVARTQSVSVPPAANLTNMTGACDGKTNELSLWWTTHNASLELSFTMEGNASFNQLSEVSLSYTVVSGNKTVTGSHKNSSVDAFASSGWYKCDSAQQVTMQNSTITLTNLRLQAFRSGNSTEFTGKEAACSADEPSPPTNAIVPIAVGCALAGMIVLVLVGYCIGRRKVRPGYTTMTE